MEVEGSENTPKQRRGRPKAERTVSFPKVDASWVQMGNQLIELAKLRWSETDDDLLQSGQIRKLNPELAKERKESLLVTAQDRFVKVTVVSTDPQGMTLLAGCVLLHPCIVVRMLHLAIVRNPFQPASAFHCA